MHRDFNIDPTSPQNLITAYIDSYKQVKLEPTKPASYQSNKTLCNPVSSGREFLIQVDS